MSEASVGRRARRASWLGLASTAVAVAAVALSLPLKEGMAAAGARQRARVKVAEGAKRLAEGKYELAVECFEQAHQIFPSPKIQFNLGLAYRGLGRQAQAFAAFDRFLRDGSDAAPDHAAKARAELERLARLIGFVSVTSDAHQADVFLDGVAIGGLPVSNRPVEVGAHEVVLRSPQFGSRVRTFSVSAGQRETLTIVFQPPASHPPAPPPVAAVSAPPPQPPPMKEISADVREAPRPSTFLTVGRWTATAGAAAALGAGVFFNVRSVSKRDEFARVGCVEVEGMFAGPPGCASIAAGFRSARRHSMIGYFAGGGLAVTALLLFLVPSQDAHMLSSFRAGTSIGPAGASYVGRF